MTSLRRLAPAVSLVALLTLSACGTATDSGGNASDTPSESGVEESTPPDESPTEPLDAADLPIEAGANGIELPAGVDAPKNGGTGAAWTAQDGYLYVMTFGSSTCPNIAEGDATLDGSDVVVTFQKVAENKPDRKSVV